jgi:hypothetical protein
MENKILGIFEKVDFPQFDIKGISAKIDSGAYTGSLHCTKIEEESTKIGTVLHFSPFDYPDNKITINDFTVRIVRSSNGTQEKRYFIKTFITLKGETYPVLLSLADRSNMKWPVLIGRRS